MYGGNIMKKILPYLVILSLIGAALPTVLADDGCPPGPPYPECAWDDANCVNVTTEAVMYSPGGGGDPNPGPSPNAPVIKVKWEYDLDFSMDLDECDPECGPCGDCYFHNETWEHDACCCIDGLQVKPIPGGEVRIGFFAVVTDNPVTDIQGVWADVWHPDGSHKYQIELTALDKTTALCEWDHVLGCHPTLITENTMWSAGPFPYNPDTGLPMTWQEDVRHELDQEDAKLYYGEGTLHYCQPGGCYKVGYIATDGLEMSRWLNNTFWYIPTSAIELDFDNVLYDNVQLGVWNKASGDEFFDPAGMSAFPTVKNIGNTPVRLYVWQDDTNFDYTGQSPPPTGTWNVKYKAQMTSDNVNCQSREYFPYETDPGFQGVEIPCVLELCTEEKLDFYINPTKAVNPPFIGEMRLCAYIEGNPGDPLWTSGNWPDPDD
jgi:hypothetical protein